MQGGAAGRLGLDPDPTVPLLGLLGRLVWQKGIDIVLEALPEILGMGFQVVIQGSGDADLERRCREAAEAFSRPRRCPYRI